MKVAARSALRTCRAAGASPTITCSSTAPPPSTRAARANAAIIRPFQAVRTLSSSCGRGRVLRTSNNTWRARTSASPTSASDFPLTRDRSAIDWAVCSRFLSVNSLCGSNGALPLGSRPYRPSNNGLSAPSAARTSSTPQM